MIISDVKCELLTQNEELSAKVLPETSQNGDFRVWFEIPADQGHLTVSGDPFLAGFLIPCMYSGENLHIDAPVSERLLNNVESIQSLITTWYPQFQKISVTCAETYQTLTGIHSEKLGQGSCFSGGVDSWYSLLKHQQTISHLILVRGFDIRTDEKNKELWDMTQKNVRLIAESLGKQLITITTNLRTQGDLQWLFHPKWDRKQIIWGKYYPRNFWGQCLHGSSLAAIALSLRSSLAEFMIPSTYSYGELEPWGSHPLLDSLWSTDSLSIIHDGCEADRLDKIKQYISQSDLALEMLRVCPKNHSQHYNCCQCEKCIRTMMQLRITGCLEKSTSFPKPLDLQKAKLLKIRENERVWYQKIGLEAERIGDKELLETIRIITEETFSYYKFYHRNIKPIKKDILTKLREVKAKL